MTFTDLTNNSKVEIIDVTKAGTGLNLHYIIDGREVNMTGDFYIDRHDVLRHTDNDANDNEIELLIKLEY